MAAALAARTAWSTLVDVDAFCEDIAFTAEQCERVYSPRRRSGLRVRLHAEQLSQRRRQPLAARHRALSCDHLEYTSEATRRRSRAAGTVAVLLPIAFYALAEKQLPPIDALRNLGVPMAIATDCNPGSAPGASLLLAMNMARRLFGLTSEEVLARRDAPRRARACAGCTSAARSTPGRAADFAVWSIATPDELGYWVGLQPVQHGRAGTARSSSQRPV